MPLSRTSSTGLTNLQRFECNHLRPFAILRDPVQPSVKTGSLHATLFDSKEFCLTLCNSLFKPIHSMHPSVQTSSLHAILCNHLQASLTVRSFPSIAEPTCSNLFDFVPERSSNNHPQLVIIIALLSLSLSHIVYRPPHSPHRNVYRPPYLPFVILCPTFSMWTSSIVHSAWGLHP